MCVVSAVHDHYNDWWNQPPTITPFPNPNPSLPQITYTPGDPLKGFTREVIEKIEDFLEMAEEIDALLGEPDCHDPSKAKWLEEVKALLDRMEALEASRE